MSVTKMKILLKTGSLNYRKMIRTTFYTIVFVVVTARDTSATATGTGHQSHRHRHGEELLRHSPGRHGREINIPQFQSYVADTRGNEGFTYVPLTPEEKNMHQNLHKPNFVDCANLKPSIPEAEPVGTPVIQITAVDADPPESGGTVTYSIVANNEMNADFEIDPQTGLITTRKIFDRDEPAKEKEVYVTVQASDNGNPRLDAVCTLKVQITDINDNAAQFLLSRRFNQGQYVPEHQWNPSLDKYEYKESMPQDLAVGQVVMRISATDIDDGNNGTVVYKIEPHPNNREDVDFFSISSTTGEITLKRIVRDQSQFQLRISACDMGNPPLCTQTDLSIIVTEPSQRPPEFVNPPTTIHLDEYNYNLSIPVAKIEARSNADDELVFFELVNGHTQYTNKENIFTLETEGRNAAFIKLERQLDYESTTKFMLTIRAQNKYNLAAETLLTIVVNDQNDEKPYFTDVTSGAVLENEPAGTSVMRVRAIDKDGTAPNNEVTYYLKNDEEDNFSVDLITGEIKTKKSFDREAKDTYQLIVYAKDGAPSVILNNGQPNERPLTLRIAIADKNDNPPMFVKQLYEAEMVEDADLNRPVVEVKATDLDTASVLQYSIIDGNIGDAFAIKSTSTSGVISVKNKLDYEKIREYELTIRVSDSVYEAKTKVKIHIQNVNDERPQFEPMKTNTTIEEESIPPQCIFRVRAYDPDIGDRNVLQNISYSILTGKEHFSVGPEDGCVRVIKPLDREDKPFYQVVVRASDEWGLAPTKLDAYMDLIVNLIDINDNAPQLFPPKPVVVWYENQPRGPITTLDAVDADTPENGPPFTFSISSEADPKIRELFSIEGKVLKANKDDFDREEVKEYAVPVAISDNGTPTQTGTSILTVIIGDENDNQMKDGESKIFVYKYKQSNTFPIGRVYVEDADDWDLPDKTFTLKSPGSHFTVDAATGDINMQPSAMPGLHQLICEVHDSKWGNDAIGIVNITVKEITDEAVDNSGSIRFMGTTKEQFIKPDRNGLSKKDKLQRELAKIFGVPVENVDIFTVGNSPSNPDKNYFDVRYSVHNSPYWKAEKLNGILAESKDLLEGTLELNIVMIGIDECLKEKHFCEASCTNKLEKGEIPLRIFTNSTSFVGVDAFVQPICSCSLQNMTSPCMPNPCLNQGICVAGGGMDGFMCECKTPYTGPQCEITSISLDGTGLAWFPSLSVCNDSILQIEFATNIDGLLFYNGPIYKSSVSDFISLELQNGKPVLLMDYGSGVTRLELRESSELSNGHHHKIKIEWSSSAISLRIDECRRNEVSCYATARPQGPNSQLNVNGPFQVGGISFNPAALKQDMNWSAIPSRNFFDGCIANLSFNGDYFDLGNPSYSTVNVTTCDPLLGVVSKATLGFGYNFIIIIALCIIILLLLIGAILVYRKKKSYEEVKGEIGDDVRENIINYSDEGGGEGDQTGYDLSVLLKPANGPYIGSPNDKIPMDSMLPIGRIPDGDGPDISSFLEGNKDKVDNDPDGLPYDDVRNYAYEGDGNSVGSLSSLASGTDDGDLNFDYLPTFGPRFKKLADMYGGQSSDDESYAGPSTEAWC